MAERGGESTSWRHANPDPLLVDSPLWYGGDPRHSGAMDGGLDDDLTPDPCAIADVARVRSLLIEAARAGHAISYSALLGQLGFRFSRPKMRALCRTLDAIDREAAAGEPALAVLVVRESDGLPGQGWWAGGHAFLLGHDGPWTGGAARSLVDRLQAGVFAYWAAAR